MWKTISSRVIFKHPRITLIEDEVELPNGKRSAYLKFQDSTDGVNVLCHRKGKYLLQKEYQYPINDWLYQMPGGGIAPGEDPKDAAVRELEEEAGIVAKELTLIGVYYDNARRGSHKTFLYLAENWDKTPSKREDEEEETSLCWFSETEIEKMIASGEINYFPVLSDWAIYKAKYLNNGQKNDNR